MRRKRQPTVPGRTERREPRHTANTRLLARVLECADEAVTIADQDGFIIEANEAVQRIYRWPKKEVLGFHPLKFCPDRDDLNWPALSTTIWATIRKKGEWNGVVVNRDKKGRCFHILLKTRKVVFNRVPYVISYARPFPEGVPFNLSPKEARVFTLLGQGRVPKEIGEELGMRETTVRTHLKRIWQKACGNPTVYNLRELECLALRCLEAGWNSGMKINEEIRRSQPSDAAGCPLPKAVKNLEV